MPQYYSIASQEFKIKLNLLFIHFYYILLNFDLMKEIGVFEKVEDGLMKMVIKQPSLEHNFMVICCWSINYSTYHYSTVAIV